MVLCMKPERERPSYDLPQSAKYDSDSNQNCVRKASSHFYLKTESANCQKKARGLRDPKES